MSRVSNTTSSSSRMERPPRNSCYYNPPSSSFSSTLLDTIYRSFDESHHFSSQSPRNDRKKHQETNPDFFQELSTLKKQQQRNSHHDNSYPAKNAPNPSVMKKSSSAYQVRGWMTDTHNSSSTMEVDDRSGILSRGQQKRRSNGRRFSLGSVESISSSSDDVDGPFYRGYMGQTTRTTPAEEDSNNTKKKKKNSKLSLKPIRTSVSVPILPELDQKLIRPSPRQQIAVDDTPHGTKNHHCFAEQQRTKSEGKSTSSAKSRAMKFYGDLKRMKQPISPGGRLATFLNSLFSAASNGGSGSRGAKKQRISTSSDGGRWERDLKSPAFTATTTPSTNCSTASSLSRSCLSSKSTSTYSTTTGEKRSVRFCPVSVIIDEDLRPCGKKSLRSSSEEEEELIRLRIMEKNRRVEEAARDLLKNHKTMRDIMDVVKREKLEINDEEEDDDGASCCSSDLFELENLLEIGRHHHRSSEVDRYREELPVYETTHLGTNRAIANGLIV